jgi:hypothetical protein
MGIFKLEEAHQHVLVVFTPPSTPSAAVPNNWVGIWADMSVTAGQVTYGTTGVAPNRKFVVNYNAVNFFSATPSSTHQIILNELDNSIEVHLTSNVTSSVNQRAMAIENANGTIAFVPPARNVGTWSSTNESWKFSPVVQSFTYDWSANPTYLSSTTIANPIATNMTTSQTYSVLVTDANGCSNTNTLSIDVNGPTSSTTVISLPCGSNYLWNGTTYSLAGIYTATTLNVAGCDSLQTLDLSYTGCNTVLNVTAVIQGYWLGTEMAEVLSLQGEPTTLGVCDSIDVSLVDSATLTIVTTKRAVLNKNGLANVVFPGSFTGSYYIKLEHRNAMETWSKYTVSMSGTPSYNFTTAADQAYGDNQVEVSPGIFALYSGDIIKDANEAIELTDIAQLESDNSNFAFGYQASDINGDGGVDLGDFPLVEANVNGFIFANHP